MSDELHVTIHVVFENDFLKLQFETGVSMSCFCCFDVDHPGDAEATNSFPAAHSGYARFGPPI